MGGGGGERSGRSKVTTIIITEEKGLKIISPILRRKVLFLRGKLVQFYLILNLAKARREG